jgi:hypothetical protein
VAWVRDGDAGPSGPDLDLEGLIIYDRRLLLERERRRLSGVLKLAGKVGSRDGGVVAWPFVVGLVPWRSPGRRVGLGRRGVL